MEETGVPGGNHQPGEVHMIPTLGGERSKGGRKFESSGVGSPGEVHSTLALVNTEMGGQGSSLRSHATHRPSLSMGHSGN